MTSFEQYGLLIIVDVISIMARCRETTSKPRYYLSLLLASLAAALLLSKTELPLNAAERALIAFFPAMIAEDVVFFNLCAPVVIAATVIPIGVMLLNEPVSVSVAWGLIALLCGASLALTTRAPIADSLALASAVFVLHLPALIGTCLAIGGLLLYHVAKKAWVPKAYPFAGALALACLAVVYYKPEILL